jgi:hypothetical protein
MMADVACFCGCYFSFEGGAAVCPRCGEVASAMGGLPYQQNEQTRQAYPEWAEADTWSDLLAALPVSADAR